MDEAPFSMRLEFAKAMEAATAASPKCRAKTSYTDHLALGQEKDFIGLGARAENRRELFARGNLGAPNSTERPMLAVKWLAATTVTVGRLGDLVKARRRRFGMCPLIWRLDTFEADILGAQRHAAATARVNSWVVLTSAQARV